MTGYNPYRDGITNSLLQRWIICRHRFWLYAIAGLEERRSFDHKIFFGDCMHIGHEGHAQARKTGHPEPDSAAEEKMDQYISRELARWGGDSIAQNEIPFWGKIAKAMLRMYSKTHARHLKRIIPVEQESKFKVKYHLPSGRFIFLRGKRDGIYRLSRRSGNMILEEYKHRGSRHLPDEHSTPNLAYDLQTGLYVVASVEEGYGITGVRYNQIRRPLSDPSSPRPRKGETPDQFCDRVLYTYERRSESSQTRYPVSAFPEHYFLSWDLTITQNDIQEFRRMILDPLLEQFCDWWESIRDNPEDPWHTRVNGKRRMNPHHFLRPYGVFDSVAQGFSDSYQNLITTGSTTGLSPAENLFPELE